MSWLWTQRAHGTSYKTGAQHLTVWSPRSSSTNTAIFLCCVLGHFFQVPIFPILFSARSAPLFISSAGIFLAMPILHFQVCHSVFFHVCFYVTTSCSCFSTIIPSHISPSILHTYSKIFRLIRDSYFPWCEFSQFSRLMTSFPDNGLFLGSLLIFFFLEISFCTDFFFSAHALFSSACLDPYSLYTLNHIFFQEFSPKLQVSTPVWGAA